MRNKVGEGTTTPLGSGLPSFLQVPDALSHAGGIKRARVTKSGVLTISLPQPVPTNLREQRVSFIESALEERLPDLHRRLPIAERDELWKEIDEQA
jgi:hypothetical protein